MVPSVEQQMHQFLIEQEEKRCKNLEAKYAADEKTHGKVVKRRRIQKPWTRPGNNALCQDSDLLILISAYDYVLSEKGFQDYCTARGVLHAAGEIGSKRWGFFLNHEKTREEYLSDPHFQFAVEVNGRSYQYTRDEMDADWKTILIGRAVLQDCWELYSKRVSK